MHQDKIGELRTQINEALEKGKPAVIDCGAMQIHVGGESCVLPSAMSLEEIEREMEERPYPPLPEGEGGKSFEEGVRYWLR